MPDPDHLWQRILRALRVGQLAYPSHLTPAEIAADVLRARGDERVSQFVWKYHYPTIYGKQVGEWSLADAERIVEEIERDLGCGKKAKRRSGPVSPPRPAGDTCAICGRHTEQNGASR